MYFTANPVEAWSVITCYEVKARSSLHFASDIEGDVLLYALLHFCKRVGVVACHGLTRSLERFDYHSGGNLNLTFHPLHLGNCKAINRQYPIAIKDIDFLNLFFLRLLSRKKSNYSPSLVRVTGTY